MSATPGQAAYEAGGGAIHSYERIQRRAWDDLPPAVREGYEAAAQAAVDAFLAGDSVSAGSIREALAAQEPHAAPELAEVRPASMLRPVDFDDEPETEPLREPQPAPGLAALRQAAARELVTAADRDQLSAELGKLKQLLDDFTHAVIDLNDGARLVGIDRLAKAAHAVRAKAGLPIIDQFSHPAGPPA